jgi:hypothetical protein
LKVANLDSNVTDRGDPHFFTTSPKVAQRFYVRAGQARTEIGRSDPLEYSVIILPFRLQRHFFGKSPALCDRLVFNPVEIDVDAWGELMRSLRSY